MAYELAYRVGAEGRRWSDVDDLWVLAIRYAADNGLVYQSSYGVVGVAPT